MPDVTDRRPAMDVPRPQGLLWITVILELRTAFEIDITVRVDGQFLSRRAENMDLPEHCASDRSGVAQRFLRRNAGRAVAFGSGVIFPYYGTPPLYHAPF